MKKSYFVYLFLFFFLIVVVYIVYSLSQGRTNFFGKAAGSGIFNAANSYIFASPLVAKAGGEKIRVTVFALDGQGRGVPAKTVIITCVNAATCKSGGISFAQVQPETDSLGQGIFDLSSTSPGQYELQAQIEGIAIPQTVTVNFQ